MNKDRFILVLLVAAFFVLSFFVLDTWFSSCEDNDGTIRFGLTSQGYAYYCDED